MKVKSFKILLSFIKVQFTFVFLFFFTNLNFVDAQCIAYDGTGALVNNPVWLGCFGTDYTLNFQSTTSFGAYTIDWGDGSPLESGASLVPPQSLTHIYPATVNSFTVTFTEPGTGCQILGTVVMEEPTTASIQIPFGGITQTCAPAPLSFINSSTNNSTTTVYTWNFGDGTPPLVFDYTNQGDTVVHNYLKGTVNCETQVSLTAENMCNTAQGGVSQATFNPIRIWDLDDAAITASDVLLCFPETTVDFENTTDRNCILQGNTFQRQEYWNFGDYWGLGYDSIVDWAPWPPTFPYTIDYPGLGSYDVMLIDSNFCGQDTANITIQIVPPPTALFTLSDDTICVNEIVLATNLSTGGANVNSWNFGDGTGWQINSGNPTHTYIAPGDYTVQLAVSIAGANGCTDTVDLPIHVLPIPQANFLVDSPFGCDSLTVNYTDASINAVGWTWNFDNGNVFNGQFPPSQFYPSDGIYNPSLTVTASNGCTNTKIGQVDVFLSPIVSFIPQSVCANVLATFTDQSTSSTGDPIIQWSWNFDNGQTSTQASPTSSFITPGLYDISLEVQTAHCNNQDTIQITVESLPQASFTQDVNTGCADLSVNFTNTTTGASSYSWTFGDGNSSTLLNPSNTFGNNTISDTIYQTMLIASTTFGCTDTAYSNSTVYFNVQANFTHNGFPGCAPLDVQFSNTSTLGQIYEWNFGDASALDNNYNTTHLYTNLSQFITVYDVDLVVTSLNGCTDTNTQQITVYPLPDFSFSSVPDSGCSPLNVDFPSIVGAVSYSWDFGDGTFGTGPSPSHLYSNSSTNDIVYNVELIAISPFGCQDTNTGTVKVFPNPTAQFNTLITQGCTPLVVNLENTSIGSTIFHWIYDDGTSSDTTLANHLHTYINTNTIAEIFNTQLIAYTDRGCTDTATQLITVFPEVIAQFQVDTGGCTPFHAFFTDLSSNANSWHWDFDNANTDVSQNPNEYLFNPGNTDSIYTIQLIATSSDGCQDTAYQDILVYPVPNAVFTATPTSQMFPNSIVSINNASTLGSWNYNWDYGDGNLATGYNPVDYDYQNWGDYDIQLIVSSPYCSDTAVQSITIIPPLPDPQVYGSGFGCRPVSIQFIDSSEYVDSYYWDFGDGGFSTLPNPYYTYHIEGSYDITLTVTGPGGVQTLTLIDSVEVYEYANAFFQHTPTNVYVPTEPVIFYNLSSDADSYIWYFGDGDSSLLEEPIHNYLDAGTYDVMLVANNVHNCPDTILVPEAVFAETGGEITYPNAFTPNSSGANGGYYDAGAFDNDIFFPVFKGVEEYQLMIFNRWGELIFETFDINQGWDGYYREVLCQQDVYIWKAKVKFTNGDENVFLGELHLIR